MGDIYREVGTSWLKSRVDNDFAVESNLYIEHVVSKISNRGNLQILDMCCGYGRVSIPLAKRGHFVTGFDISETLLKSAESEKKSASLSNVDFVKADILSLPFRSDTFDVVLCMWASFNFVINIEDQVRIIKEVSGLLKSKGIAVIDLPNDHSTSEEVLRANVEGSVYHYFQHTKRHLKYILSRSFSGNYTIEERKFGSKDRFIVLILKNG